VRPGWRLFVQQQGAINCVILVTGRNMKTFGIQNTDSNFDDDDDGDFNSSFYLYINCYSKYQIAGA